MPRRPLIHEVELAALQRRVQAGETTVSAWADAHWQRMGYASATSARNSIGALLRARGGGRLRRRARLDPARARQLLAENAGCPLRDIAERHWQEFDYASAASMAATLHRIRRRLPAQAMAWCASCDAPVSVVEAGEACPACLEPTLAPVGGGGAALSDAHLQALHAAHRQGRPVRDLADAVAGRLGTSPGEARKQITDGFMRLGLGTVMDGTRISLQELEELSTRVAAGEMTVGRFAAAHWQRLGYASETSARVRLRALLRERGLAGTSAVSRRRVPVISEERVRELHGAHVAGTPITRLAAEHWADLGFTSAAQCARAIRREFAQRRLPVHAPGRPVSHPR